MTNLQAGLGRALGNWGAIAVRQGDRVSLSRPVTGQLARFRSALVRDPKTSPRVPSAARVHLPTWTCTPTTPRPRKRDRTPQPIAEGEFHGASSTRRRVVKPPTCFTSFVACSQDTLQTLRPWSTYSRGASIASALSHPQASRGGASVITISSVRKLYLMGSL